MFQNFGVSSTHNPMKDFEVQQPPDDSISKIAFSPNANYLIAGSWDNNVRRASATQSRPLVYRAWFDHTSVCQCIQWLL